MAIGIENLKTVAKFGIDLGENISAALADSKITLSEAVSLLPTVMSLPGIIEKKADIVAEFKDLDSAERSELNAYIAAEFDIADDELENKIEKGLSAVVAVLDLVSAFQKPAA